MTGLARDDRLARAALTYLAEPADPILGDLLQAVPPTEVLTAIQSGSIPADAADGLAPYRAGSLASALARWRDRLPGMSSDAVEQHAARGIQLVCPGDPGWPLQLNDLDAARPYALWVRGTTDLRSVCAQSVAVIGTRAATAYGMDVCTQIAADLAERGWTIVSGGAHGTKTQVPVSVLGRLGYCPWLCHWPRTASAAGTGSRWPPFRTAPLAEGQRRGSSLMRRRSARSGTPPCRPP